MSGSGAQTGMARIIIKIPPPEIRKAFLPAPPGWYGAAAGTTTRGTFDQPTVAAILPLSAAAIWVFASVYPVESSDY